MGYSSYSAEDRKSSVRATAYHTQSVDDTFKQNRERKAHSQLKPEGITVRECRDSKEHPLTVPIQLYLDVTGSMGHIPHQMIKTGLPTLMSTLIQSGVEDASLMFGAIGDHECDSEPLQVAQFESGDEELDGWLEKTYLEGGGGGNAGESYALAYYFAAFHTQTDAWEKRKTKGFIFTIGDEPCLPDYPHSAIKNMMGSTAVGQAGYNLPELLAKAQESNHVFHIHLTHGYGGRNDRSTDQWGQLLGENLIVLEDHNDVSKTIAETILKHSTHGTIPAPSTGNNGTTTDTDML